VISSRCWRWFPTGDRAGALSRLGVVDDAGEQPTQFDGRRQLALLLEESADRSRIGLGDEEHLQRMATRRTTGKPGSAQWPPL
jgi:hypothetical protein